MHAQQNIIHQKMNCSDKYTWMKLEIIRLSEISQRKQHAVLIYIKVFTCVLEWYIIHILKNLWSHATSYGNIYKHVFWITSLTISYNCYFLNLWSLNFILYDFYYPSLLSLCLLFCTAFYFSGFPNILIFDAFVS